MLKVYIIVVGVAMLYIYNLVRVASLTYYFTDVHELIRRPVLVAYWLLTLWVYDWCKLMEVLPLLVAPTVL